MVVGCVWIGRASINQAEPEGFRGGRDRGKRVVKDREEREREPERYDGAGGDGGTAGGLEKKRECGWRGGEERREEEHSDCKSGGVRGGRWGDGVWVGG